MKKGLSTREWIMQIAKIIEGISIIILLALIYSKLP